MKRGHGGVVCRALGPWGVRGPGMCAGRAWCMHGKRVDTVHAPWQGKGGSRWGVRQRGFALGVVA